MPQEIRDFFAPAAKHRLSAREKETMYAELRRKLPSAEADVYRGSALWRALRSIFSSWTPVVAVVVISVLTGAGITSAESALPGDFLYPIKRMNERISAAASFTTQTRAAVETRHMDKRLDEAVALEAKGELNAQTTEELDQAYRLERRDATKHIVELEQQGNANLAAQMRARLNASEDRYERLFKGKRRNP